jgi:hypothetical protein
MISYYFIYIWWLELKIKDNDIKTICFFFVIFKKTQWSKPKISQIKTYLQETPRIKIFFRFKANGWTLCFFETRFVPNLKKKILVIFL